MIYAFSGFEDCKPWPCIFDFRFLIYVSSQTENLRILDTELIQDAPIFYILYSDFGWRLWLLKEIIEITGKLGILASACLAIKRLER